MCTSPTSIISLLDTDSSKGLFSDRQAQAIADVLTEATELLGADVDQLPLKDTHATRLGLPPSTTYAEALEAVLATGSRKQARDFTGAVLALRSDARVQGFELAL
jgi:hypothetical protein